MLLSKYKVQAKTVILFLILIVLILFSLFFFRIKQFQTRQIIINGNIIQIEIADSNEERIRGLSNRTSLPDSSGMLFIFPDVNYHSIWMKEMNFPIDIIWIKYGIIVDLVNNAPVPVNNLNIATFTPQTTADSILEMRAGAIKRYRMKIGDNVKF